MISLVEKDSIAYGIYAGCTEVLLFIGLFIADLYLRSEFEGVISFLIFTLPVLLGSLFIKQSMVKAHCKDPQLGGFMLFKEGYTTGLFGIVTFIAIVRFASIISYLSDMNFTNFGLVLFRWVYQDIVIFGMGLISAILVSYIFYHIISHHKVTKKHKHAHRRLPGKVDTKRARKKSKKATNKITSKTTSKRKKTKVKPTKK